MARTNKTVTSNDSDDHLGREAKLRKDSLIQTEKHTNKIRALKGLPPIPTTDPTIGAGTPDDVGVLTLDDAGDDELVRDADLIVGLRDYSAEDNCSVDEDSFVAIHRKIRRERFRYRDLNGKMMQALGRPSWRVKGRAGRGSVHLTENEWPTAANVRERYWLYVVVDCATNPVLYRVQDPAFKLAVKSRQSFTVNFTDIVREAEND